MPDMYYIDLIQPRTGFIGSNDYIVTGTGGLSTTDKLMGHHHHHGHAGRRYYSGGQYEVPLLYTIEFGDVAMRDDTRIPDNVGGSSTMVANAGWRIPARDLAAEYTRYQRRAPDAAARANLARLAERINAVLRRFVGGRKPNRQDEMDFNTAQNLATFYVQNNRGPQHSDPAAPNPGPETSAVINAAVNAVPHASSFPGNVVSAIGSVAGDTVHTLNSAAGLAGKAIHQAGQAVSHIPVVGTPLKAVVDLNPFVAAGNFASSIAHGERLDHAVLENAKRQIQAVREVAPYVKMVSALVPGVGTGIAAAIAAGTALADGRAITDAVLDSMAAAVPGGALGKTVFTATTAILHGSSITDAALEGALTNLPPTARDAARIAIAAAKGKNVREAVLQAIRAHLPPEARKALEIGTALGVARNIQSNVARAVGKPSTIAKLASHPVPRILESAVPKASGPAKGFKTAVALVSHSGVSATSLAAARNALSADEKAGFDHGLKAYINTIAQSELGSLVRGGVVARGKWRPAKAGEKGTPGRLVQNGRVTTGSYVRA